MVVRVVLAAYPREVMGSLNLANNIQKYGIVIEFAMLIDY